MMLCELCRAASATKMDIIEGHLCDECYGICVPLSVPETVDESEATAYAI